MVKPKYFGFEFSWKKNKDELVKILSKCENSINEIAYKVHYTLEGTLGVINLWLKGGCEESTEEIAKIILKLVNKGGYS